MNCDLDNIIKSSKKILLLSHMNPDGDTLGSMCGLYHMIYKRYKKKPDMNIVSNIPFNYKFLPNINLAQRYFDKSLVYDLVITLDVASIERTLDAKIFFDKASVTVNIDHHKTNPGFGDYQIIEPNASSCGEVLYNYFKKNNWNIDSESAICLYTAIMTDTGNFKFENTSANVFKAVAELVELGANPNFIYKKCYETKTKNFVLFQNYCVNKAEFINDNKNNYSKKKKKPPPKVAGGGKEGLVEELTLVSIQHPPKVTKIFIISYGNFILYHRRYSIVSTPYIGIFIDSYIF